MVLFIFLKPLSFQNNINIFRTKPLIFVKRKKIAEYNKIQSKNIPREFQYKNIQFTTKNE